MIVTEAGSQEIQDIVHGQEEPFMTGAKITKKQINQITNLFKNEKNIVKFRDKSLSLLNE